MDKINYLSQFNLLHALEEEDLVEMDRLTVITTVPKHAFIQTPDTFSEKLFFVKKGKVRLYKLSADGKSFTSDILHEGNVFGELGAISFGTRDHFIETMEECHICHIDHVRFQDFLLHHPRFLMSLTEVLGKRLARMSRLNEKLAIGNLHEQILCVLQQLTAQFGGEADGGDCDMIDLRITHQEVASLVGASREAVSIALQELSREGKIRTGYRAISLCRDNRMND
ncbi:Crp/Fnr family transcriptional regulator [Paenibacillus sp. J5C_2022]|uniref:Crp/Fnr family transcriptional regulator n=1 Tax=Paenibacillus sp. J5C2022 TaxID=2977129 RepID=UPI0021CF1D3D|nr:Crp/Fnr family transcriptional regulator [Paenibacillus sp. J5C2022]MCU6709989.1 Crp/Fnr family transcriptional regulator [Paenibacillus sp. J5C2022]